MPSALTVSCPMMEEGACQTASSQPIAATSRKPAAATSLLSSGRRTCCSRRSSKVALRYPLPCAGWPTPTEPTSGPGAGRQRATAAAHRRGAGDAVQYPGGFLTYGLPLSATARLLHGDEASRATGKLASEHPVQHRFLIPLLQWARRRQMMIYELLADDAQGQHLEGFRAPAQRGDRSGGHAVHASGEVARIYWVRTHVADCGVASIACIWPTPAHVTLPSAKEAARQARLRAPGSTRRPAAPPPGTS
jgi:hypothetical protein